ncbi:hypothetical protein C8Q80DRAFT_545277 [Daedaleopsis nitida]|nr:hypothetical protein C8Q80DRAFT_545277 [Daedaleopsis nitida]
MTFTQYRKPLRTISVKDELIKKTPKPKIHKCERNDCDKFFSRKPDMIRHLRSVHEGRKDFLCRWPGCDKSFSQQATLSTHENIHTGEKPWVCPCEGCSRAFGDQSSCARHYREQHTGMTHYCPYCPSVNKRLTEFRSHLGKAHNILELDLKLYRLPIHLTVDDLAVLPQFNEEGMNGIEMRRRKPGGGRGSRNAYSVATPTQSFEALSQYLIPMPMTRTSSNGSVSTTPSLSSSSVSPSPSLPLLDIGLDGFSVESAHVGYSRSGAMDGNFLGVDFGSQSGNVTARYVSSAESATCMDNAQYSGAYDSASHSQFTSSHPQGWEKSYMDPELLAASGLSTGYDSAYDYDPNLMIRASTSFQNVPFQAGWPNAEYMAPISQLSRSTHAQGSAWGPAHQ